MVEHYFDHVSKKFYSGEELEDVRPELCYQSGATPEGIEKARNHQAIVESLQGEDKPTTGHPPAPDAKWRFFWKIGERPKEVDDQLPQVIPKDFPDWEDKMNGWGYQMVNSCMLAAEMAALGMGLDKEAFTSRMF